MPTPDQATPAPMIDILNLRTMHKPSSVAEYAIGETLTAAERASLDRVREEALNRPILDLGVGAGRTIKPLMDVSQDYLGIDYSMAMLREARRRHPHARLEHADARDLRQIPDGSIFLAMFSCNGLGMVSHEDRLRIMEEIYRVLEPGGVFLFSTHNQDSPAHSAGFQLPRLRPSLNPLKLGLRTLRFGRDTLLRVLNRNRFVKHEKRGCDYSIINDLSHNYATLLYYISLKNQRDQLRRIGFHPDAEAFDRAGSLVQGTCRDTSLAFVARKPSA